MNKPVKITLIASASVISTGIVMAASYLKGKRDGFKLGVQAAGGELNESTTEAPRNTHRAQASA